VGSIINDVNHIVNCYLLPFHCKIILVVKENEKKMTKFKTPTFNRMRGSYIFIKSHISNRYNSKTKERES
jgi:hypothetical protein